MSIISDIFKSGKKAISAIFGVMTICEILAPGWLAIIVGMIGVGILLFSKKRGLGLVIVGLSLFWFLIVDQLILIPFFKDIGYIQSKKEVRTYTKTAEEMATEKRRYQANYVLNAYLFTKKEGDSGNIYKNEFDANEEIRLGVKFNKKRGFVYNREYPEENLVVCLSYEQKIEREHDPYAPIPPLEKIHGFKYPHKDSSFIHVERYKYLRMVKPADDGYINWWIIKEKNEYIETGEWEAYLFMIPPPSGFKYPPKRFRTRSYKIYPQFPWDGTITLRNFRWFLDDELVAKLTFKVN